MTLKILLSIFPFAFATILAVWAILLLAWAIRSWDRFNAKMGDPDVVGTAFGAILVAAAACIFGAAGLALFQ